MSILRAVPDLEEDGYGWPELVPQQAVPSGRSDGGPWRELTAAELDELEAHAHHNPLVPAAITLAIVADERRRRAQRINKAHALAGWPLGRPR